MGKLFSEMLGTHMSIFTFMGGWFNCVHVDKLFRIEFSQKISAK